MMHKHEWIPYYAGRLQCKLCGLIGRLFYCDEGGENTMHFYYCIAEREEDCGDDLFTKRRTEIWVCGKCGNKYYWRRWK